MDLLNKKNVFFIFGTALICGAFFIWVLGSRSIEIGREKEDELKEPVLEYPKNPISGLSCKNYNQRPMAVILAEDPVTRPLAGLSEADLVFEMSVITGSITRMMAIYVCGSPKEVGSLRSARHDFTPLAMGLDAILAHWGGSHYSLDKLNAGLMENIDALKNPFNAFYQKKEIPQPHNGFTSMERLINSANKLSYRLEGKFEGYPHEEIANRNPPAGGQIAKKTLEIDYSYPYNVEYQYNSQTNSYLRFRAGQPEIDKNNNQQIQAKVIIIMRAVSRQIEGPYYNDVDVEGEGDCQIYQNGEIVFCVWRKDKNNQESKLYFLDESGQEIKFTPGQIWIEIVEPEQKITWE